jgi:predicted metal-dependent peptidase
MDEDKKYALLQHEALHAWLKHIPRHRDSTKEEAQLADYVADEIIEEIDKGPIHKHMFTGERE